MTALEPSSTSLPERAAPPTRSWPGLVPEVLDLAPALPGLAALAACLFPLHYLGRLAIPSFPSVRALGYGALAWVAGLCCCALGRQLRRALTRWLRPRGALAHRLRKALLAHGLATRLAPAAEGTDHPGAEYTSAPQLLRRLRGELEQDPQLVQARAGLRRRRARVAVYDGVAAALVAWCLVFWVAPRYVERWPATPSVTLAVGAAFLLLALVCWVEAERNSKESLQALVAALAPRYAARPRPPAPPPPLEPGP